MTDLRTDLDDAIEELSEETHGTPTHTDGALPSGEDDLHAKQGESEETTASAEAPEEGGSESAASETEDKPTSDAGAATGAETTEQPDKQATKQDLNAPVDWSPQAREKWSKIPVELQQQILEREQHINATLELAAEDRRAAQGINEMAHAYAPLMAQEGVTDPLQAIQGMFDSASKMRNGTQEQRATHVANLVKYYGIDIGALDDALSGQQNVQASPNAQMEDMINQRMAPINDFISQLNSRQEQNAQQQQQAALAEIEQFDGEFLQDLRPQMADFIDMAAQQGRKLNLREAYDMAVASNPEISNIVAERQRNAQMLGQQENIADKRSAAISLAGGGQPATQSGEMSLREQIESAMG